VGKWEGDNGLTHWGILRKSEPLVASVESRHLAGTAQGGVCTALAGRSTSQRSWSTTLVRAFVHREQPIRLERLQSELSAASNVLLLDPEHHREQHACSRLPVCNPRLL
jgi:hypothetical protein